MALLGQLVIELLANTARLQSDMGKAVGIAERGAAKLKSAFKFAGGGLIGAALVNVAKQSIEFGDNIQKAATKAGVGGKAMSELAYAAKLADVDIAALSTSIKKMQVSLSEAGTGAKGPTTALNALGLSIDQLKKRDAIGQFEVIAERISQLKDPADRARAAVELFGKAGADLLPLFEQGAAGIAKARAEAEKLGLSFSDDQIKKLSTADDAIKRLDASWKGFATTLTAYVAPALTSVLDALSGMDNRSTDQKIAHLQEELRLTPSRPWTKDRRASIQTEIDQLTARRDLEAVRAAQTGTTGGPTSRRSSGVAIGYAAADAAEKAQEEARKAAAAEEKELEKLSKSLADTVSDLQDDLTKEIDETRNEEFDKFLENEMKKAEEAKKIQEDLDAWRKEQSYKLSENAQIFKDAFLNAYDDMVNTGKFKWDELLKYMIAEFARRGIVRLFDSIFAGGGGSGGGGGLLGGLMPGGKVSGGGPWGWLSKIPGIGGMLGFAGGGRPAPGIPYLVGERGPEVRVDGPGSIIPNHALGGARVVITQHNDFRGASMDVMKALPKILRDNNRHLEAMIIGKLERSAYPGLA